MTTPGDIITAGTAGAPSRLAAGNNGQVLAVVSGVPAWTTDTFPNPMTTPGDIITAGTAGAPSRLAAGNNGQVLSVVSGVPAWTTDTFPNPMTTPGDIITAGTAGAPSRLAAGTNGQVLAVVSGVPAWNSALTLNSLQITVFPTATNPAPYGIRWVDNPSSYFYDSSVTNSNWYGVALPKAGTDAPCSDNQHNTSPVGPLALNNGYDLANVANCYVIVPPGTRSFRFSGYAALGGGIRTSSYFSILWGTISDTPSISSNSTGVSVTLMSPPFPDGSMLLMHDQGSGIGAEFGPNLAIIGGWRQSASLPNYTNVMISEAYSSNIIAVRVL
jgi:hypothetical protein